MKYVCKMIKDILVIGTKLLFEVYLSLKLDQHSKLLLSPKGKPIAKVPANDLTLLPGTK
jgi:hypothetical protein